MFPANRDGCMTGTFSFHNHGLRDSEVQAEKRTVHCCSYPSWVTNLFPRESLLFLGIRLHGRLIGSQLPLRVKSNFLHCLILGSFVIRPVPHSNNHLSRSLRKSGSGSSHLVHFIQQKLHFCARPRTSPSCLCPSPNRHPDNEDG